MELGLLRILSCTWLVRFHYGVVRQVADSFKVFQAHNGDFLSPKTQALVFYDAFSLSLPHLDFCV